MDIRTNLTDEQATINMIELAGYLADHDVDTMELSLGNIHMEFKAYVEVEEGEEQ